MTQRDGDNRERSRCGDRQAASASSNSFSWLDELSQLVENHCNNRLSDTQAARLAKLLRNRAEARAWYADYILMHTELSWHQGSDGASPLWEDRGIAECERVARWFAKAPDDEASVSSRTRWIGLNPRSGVPSRWLPHRWVAATRWLAACLVVGLTGGTIGWIASDQRLEQMVSELVATTKSAEHQVGEPRALGPEVAQVTGTRNCRWQAVGDDRGPAIGFGSRLRAGQKLHLAEGLAEITFERGARVILEAPSRLDIAADNGSILHQGRLTAAVPAGAEGFQVEMDRFTLIDRGTEFGVMTHGDGNSEVQVFDGLVEAHFLDPDGERVRTVEWSTNQAVRVDARRGDFVHAEGAISKFVRSLTSSSRQELVASEDFDYPAGPLGGQNGGFGWGGPWVDISASGDPATTNRIAAGSLKSPGIVQTGNQAAIEAASNRIRRVLGTSLGGVFATAGFVEDQDGVRLIGEDHSTIYIGFCQRVTHAADGFYGLEIHRGDGNGNRVLCIGHGASATGYGVTSEANGGAKKTYQSLGTEPTEVTFLVVRIDFGPGHQDRVLVYRDPESLEIEQHCTVDAELIGNFAFDRIGLANFDGGKSHRVDRLRVGSSFQSLTDQHRWKEISPLDRENNYSQDDFGRADRGSSRQICKFFRM